MISISKEFRTPMFSGQKKTIRRNMTHHEIFLIDKFIMEKKEKNEEIEQLPTLYLS